jgi:hypothetical protein
VNLKRRRSNILGEYASDRFMITLGPSAAYIDPATQAPRRLDNDRLSILFHEYIHYLQNIATAAGYHGFRRALDGWRLFRETITEDGTSAGSASLAPERAKWVSQYLEIGDRFDGDVDADLPDTFEVDYFDVDGVDIVAEDMPIGALTARVTTIILKGTAWDDTGAGKGYQHEFGAVALMEGVAYELDQIVARGASGRRNPKYPSPAFPYQVLRKLITRHIPSADTRSILRIGCLALMSNDPAGALMDLCQIASENLARGASLEAAIDQVDATQIHALQDAITSSDINDHDQVFQGGTLGKGIAYINRLFMEHLTARKHDPCPELLTLTPDQRVNFEGVRELFERIRPCMVLQQGRGRDGKLGRDFLWVSGDDGFSLRNELAVLHCALHFMISHLARNHIVETAQASPSACPFYTCCTLPLRKTSPVICKRRPWRSHTWGGWGTSERCWYAVSVASTVNGTEVPSGSSTGAS